MEIVSEGSLESISRPSSTASDKGKRSIRTIPYAHPSSSLEILPPEDKGGIPSELFSALENDVEVQDFEEDDIDSDSNDDSEFSLEEDIDDYLQNSGGLTVSQTSQRPCSQDTCTPETTISNEEPQPMADRDIDLQIKEGMEKIKKLDRILSDKIKKEKEVKNHRTQMEKMWKEQLQQVANCPYDGSHSNHSLISATLLALELGNEESLGSSREDPITPVFPTQPLGTDDSHTRYQSSVASGTSCSSRDEEKESKKKDNRRRKHQKSNNRSSSFQDNDSKANKKAHKSKDKRKEMAQDFIQRNKKLAADAANVIPMTEDEKKRLEELLSTDTNEMMDNPFNADGLRLLEGVGFRPDEDSERALADIDEKLEALLPANELALLSTRSLTETPLSQGTTAIFESDSHASYRHLIDNLEDVDIGERVLREEKESRDMQHRIMEIEKELEKLKHLSEDETEDILSQELLSKLLCESSRTTSSSNTIAESVVSSLSTAHHFAIQHWPIGDTGTISALSDVTLTSTDVDTPRTLTSAGSSSS